MLFTKEYLQNLKTKQQRLKLITKYFISFLKLRSTTLFHTSLEYQSQVGSKKFDLVEIETLRKYLLFARGKRLKPRDYSFPDFIPTIVGRPMQIDACMLAVNFTKKTNAIASKKYNFDDRRFTKQIAIARAKLDYLELKIQKLKNDVLEENILMDAIKIKDLLVTFFVTQRELYSPIIQKLRLQNSVQKQHIQALNFDVEKRRRDTSTVLVIDHIKNAVIKDEMSKMLKEKKLGIVAEVKLRTKISALFTRKWGLLNSNLNTIEDQTQSIVQNSRIIEQLKKEKKSVENEALTTSEAIKNIKDSKERTGYVSIEKFTELQGKIQKIKSNKK